MLPLSVPDSDVPIGTDKRKEKERDGRCGLTQSKDPAKKKKLTKRRDKI